MRKTYLAGILAAMLLLSSCGLTEGKTPQVLGPEDIGEIVDGSGGNTPSGENGQESMPASDRTTGDGMTERDNLPTPDTGGESDGGTETQPPASVGEENGYHEIYRQAVTEHTGEAVVFALIYLDSDDIPELVVLDRGYDSYSIYTVKDNVLFCMADSLTTAELTYFERSGILCEFSRWNGGGDEGGYGRSYYQVSVDSAITSDTIPVLHDTYNAVYNDEGAYAGAGVINYYHMEQEIDETAYKEMESSLGIVEGEDRPCAENAVDGETLLSLLER